MFHARLIAPKATEIRHFCLIAIVNGKFENKNVAPATTIPKLDLEEIKEIRRKYGVHRPKIMFYIRELLPADRFVGAEEYTMFLERMVGRISFGVYRVQHYPRFLHAQGEADRRRQGRTYVPEE